MYHSLQLVVLWAEPTCIRPQPCLWGNWHGKVGIKYGWSLFAQSTNDWTAAPIEGIDHNIPAPFGEYLSSLFDLNWTSSSKEAPKCRDAADNLTRQLLWSRWPRADHPEWPISFHVRLTGRSCGTGIKFQLTKLENQISLSFVNCHVTVIMCISETNERLWSYLNYTSIRMHENSYINTF